MTRSVLVDRRAIAVGVISFLCILSLCGCAAVAAAGDAPGAAPFPGVKSQ
jgi:hypothetical protein